MKNIHEELLMKVNTLGAEALVQVEDAVDAYVARIDIGSRQQEEVWVESKFTSNAKLKPQVTCTMFGPPTASDDGLF
jgi:hypothetical protein